MPSGRGDANYGEKWEEIAFCKTSREYMGGTCYDRKQRDSRRSWMDRWTVHQKGKDRITGSQNMSLLFIKRVSCLIINSPCGLKVQHRISQYKIHLHLFLEATDRMSILVLFLFFKNKKNQTTLIVSADSNGKAYDGPTIQPG